MAVVLDALASYVQNMLIDMTREEVHMLLGVSGEVDKLDVKLRDFKKFLADADRRNITDQSVQAWVKELRNVMYDATDILDLCQLKAIEQGPYLDVGCLNPLLFCMRNPLHAHDIGSRIKNLNQRLDGIKERTASLSFVNLSSYENRNRRVTSPRLANRETSRQLDLSSVVGEKIELDTRELVKMLTEESESTGNREVNNKIGVLAIVGIGGIGKTTLAQKIFNDDTIKHEFTKKIWLSVNQDFSPSELLKRTIIEARGDHHGSGNAKATLQETLKNALEGHKTFLVMDDVWNHQAWEDVLKVPLVNAVAQGSRVLVTTRYDMVARAMKAVEPYHSVEKLGPEDAWSLLKQQVVAIENDEPHIDMLKDIGMGIIAKCDGLPLAVKVMGGLLRQKKTRRGDWEKVLNDSIWSVSQMPEELNYAMYLSYEDLHPSLKPCFLHYSLLPKSTLFKIDEIVGMWIGEGFVHGSSCDIEELGREYHGELILRNLIEPDLMYADQQVCNMHDVVRSFAQYLARDEALVAHNSEIDISGKLNSQKFIRISLETKGSTEFEWSLLQAQTSLRTLIATGHMKIKPCDSLHSFSSLRNLHAQFANFDSLAESLHLLKHLRYLSLEYTNTSKLSENIGKMKFLQYISLLGCENIVKLPDSIVKLGQLRFLNLNGTNIEILPRGLGGLTNLRRLYGFPAYMDGDWCSLEELGPLSQLTGLHICGLENVSSSTFSTKAKLGEKVRLSYLHLRCNSRIGDDGRMVKNEVGICKEEQKLIEEVFDELCPLPCLEILAIKGYFGRQLPRWLMSTAIDAPLKNLRFLTMVDLACCAELPDSLCQLPYLEILHIDHAPAIKRVGPEFLQSYHRCHNRSQAAAVFPRLSKLELFRMVEWEEWEWEDQVQAMPILEELVLERCKLRCVPPGLVFNARALRKLYVYYVEHLSSLENFASLGHLDVRECPDLEKISNLPKLQQLIIMECPKLKVLEGMPALQRLEQMVCEDMLPRYLQDINPKHWLLYCTLSLLTSIAAGKSSPEWDRFGHIKQVKVYAPDGDIPRKWYVLYTRDPLRFETNISPSAIQQASIRRKFYGYSITWPIEDEWPVGRGAYADKCQPLRLRFRGWKGGVERAYKNEPRE